MSAMVRSAGAAVGMAMPAMKSTVWGSSVKSSGSWHKHAPPFHFLLVYHKICTARRNDRKIYGLDMIYASQ